MKRFVIFAERPDGSTILLDGLHESEVGHFVADALTKLFRPFSSGGR